MSFKYLDTDFGRFGWVNASYVYGLQMLEAGPTRALGLLTTWEEYAKSRGVHGHPLMTVREN